jgi:hypothetical protein
MTYRRTKVRTYRDFYPGLHLHDAEEIVFWQGFDAGADRDPEASCRYDSSTLREAWRLGFDAGRRDGG